jgi:hypothetical protein
VLLPHALLAFSFAAAPVSCDTTACGWSFLGEGSLTVGVVALEGTLSRVGPLVVGEVAILGEGSLTAGVVASKETLFRVGPLVVGEFFFQGKSAVGVVAPKGTFSSVGPLTGVYLELER